MIGVVRRSDEILNSEWRAGKHYDTHALADAARICVVLLLGPIRRPRSLDIRPTRLSRHFCSLF